MLELVFLLVGKAPSSRSYTHCLNLAISIQVLAALSVSLGSLVVGFSSGYTSPALPSMMNRNITDFVVTIQEVGNDGFCHT